jgi:signal transduction histidine kinase
MNLAPWINRLYYVGFILLSLLSTLTLRNESHQAELRQIISIDRDRSAIVLQLQVLIQRLRSGASSAVLLQDPEELQWVEKQYFEVFESLVSLGKFPEEVEAMEPLRRPLGELEASLVQSSGMKKVQDDIDKLFFQLVESEKVLDAHRRKLDEKVFAEDSQLSSLHISAMALMILLFGGFTLFLWLLAHQSRKANRMNKVIESSEKLHKLIFSSLQDGVILCTQDGFITTVNRRMVQLLEVKNKEWRGQNLRELMPEVFTYQGNMTPAPELPKAFSLPELLDQATRGNKPIWGIRLGLKSVRWLEFSAFALETNPTDFYKSYLLSVSDITERIEKEELIRQQRAQMTQKTKLSALGELASGLAHEINNPLSQMMFETQVFQDQLKKSDPSSPENVKDFLQKISGSIQRVTRIVKGIRLYARDGQADDFQDERVADLTRDVLQILNHRNVELGIQIEAEVDPSIVVSCRPTQVAQILVNLLGNAIDAIEAEVLKRQSLSNYETADLWIKIETRTTPERLLLTVSNSGDPIPTPIQDRIFEAFFTTKEAGRGTGLGLSISREIARSHGGDLTLSSMSKHPEFILSLPHWRHVPLDSERTSSAA